MLSGKSAVLFCVLVLCSAPTACRAGDWPQFRGPAGNGTAADSNPPIHWSDSQNILWKTELPGRGASSAIVWADRIFLTAYSGYGEVADAGADPGEKANLRLHTLCFDRADGRLLWDKSIAASEATQKYGKRVADHGYATGTPATDGEAVYAYFGVSGVVAYDFEGNLLWQAETGTGTAGFGSASSPVAFENLVIVNASIESSTMFAFDRESGREVWKVESINRAWTSPCLIETSKGKTELILNHKDEVLGFDPQTGEKLWWCEGIHDYVVPVPIVHDGIAYCLGGRSNRSMAIRPGGRGDVTKTHKLWEESVGANVTSPVFFDGHIYWASDKAVMCCLEAATGKTIYRERLPTRSRIYSSIVRAGDRFYVTTRDQGVVVVAAKPEYEELAVNVIESDSGLVNASPAISGDDLLLRTDSYLYCISRNAAE